MELPADAARWPSECIGSALYLAPEVESERPYGLPADVFSFGVMCYEVYHLHTHGVDFYGDGDLFEGGGAQAARVFPPRGLRACVGLAPLARALCPPPVAYERAPCACAVRPGPHAPPALAQDSSRASMSSARLCWPRLRRCHLARTHVTPTRSGSSSASALRRSPPNGPRSRGWPSGSARPKRRQVRSPDGCD